MQQPPASSLKMSVWKLQRSRQEEKGRRDRRAGKGTRALHWPRPMQTEQGNPRMTMVREDEPVEPGQL